MRRPLAISVALMTLLLSAAPVTAASWSHPTAITDSHDAFQPYARGIAVTGAVVHLVDARTSGPLEYRQSTNGGTTWSAPLTLAQPDTRFTSVLADPAIAARGQLVVVAYRAHDTTAAYLFIRRSRDGGQTWGARQQVARVVTSRRIGEQSVAISAAGVFVTWTDRTNGDINLRRSVDDGAHFGVVQRIGVTTNTFAEGNPTYTDGLIALAAAGDAVYLAWSPSGDGTADSIVLSRSLDGGSTFGGPRTIFAGPSYGWPSLSAAGSFLVGEFQAADGTVRMARSGDLGRHVSTDLVAAPTSNSRVVEGSVVVDSTGRALLTYIRSKIATGTAAPIGGILVRRSDDGGSHWSKDEIAVGKVTSPGNISTALADTGPLLVYSSCQDPNFNVCDVFAVRGQ